MRKIIHIDMDAFYAAVEQRDDPGLQGRPIAVGAAQGRGVVLTASYEARRYGVRSAMPSVHARHLCPDLLFVQPRFDAYKQESRRIRDILSRYTDLIEPLSLDEAYLDVTVPRIEAGSAAAIGRAIKAAIRQETGLTASAGVSCNKFLAKIASDLRKPDGLTVIRPERALAFLATLEIERFHGIGPATAARMRRLGIHTGADLQARSEQELGAAFGRLGRHYWRMAQAQDERAVEPDRPRLSISVETTFARDLLAAADMEAVLTPLAGELAGRLERTGFLGHTLTLKLRYSDFQTATRRLTRHAPLVSAAAIELGGRELLGRRPRPGDGVRLLGLGVSSELARHDEHQLPLPLTDRRNAAS